MKLKPKNIADFIDTLRNIFHLLPQRPSLLLMLEMNIKIFYSNTRGAIRQTKNIKDWAKKKNEKNDTQQKKKDAA